MRKPWIAAVAALLMIWTLPWTGCSKKPQSNEDTPVPTSATSAAAPVPVVSTDPVAHVRRVPTTAAGPVRTAAAAPAPARAIPGALPPPKPEAESPEMVEMRDRYGLEVLDVAIRGPAIVVRFVVSEPEKTGQILTAMAQRYLIDQKSGTRIPVPTTIRTGRLRPEPGMGGWRTYQATFNNSKGVVRPGDKVTLVMDEYRVEGLTAQ